jgi:hypothetical protein
MYKYSCPCAKLPVVKHYAMKTYGGVEVSSTFPELGTRWRRVVRFTLLPL